MNTKQPAIFIGNKFPKKDEIHFINYGQTGYVEKSPEKDYFGFFPDGYSHVFDSPLLIHKDFIHFPVKY